MEVARIPVPGGHVSAAGGNYFHERVDLALDTRLGPFAIGAVYNSAEGWLASVDATYREGVLHDASGASHALGSLAPGEAAAGSHWVKLDETRVRTKGGLVYEFDGETGRLLAIHWATSPYPSLRFVQTPLGGAWHTSAVEQCLSGTACSPVFALAYDAAGRLVRIDDRAGRTALLAYDAEGRLASARDGLDVAKGWPGERYTYAGSFLASIASSEGERIELSSDAQGRTLEVRAVGAGDPTFRFEYGLASAEGISAVRATDPLGFVTTYSVDAWLRVASATNPLGERTDYTWSGLRPTSRTLPDGTRTSWSWANDDVASETLSSGDVRTFTYQAGGVDRERPLATPLLELHDSLGLVERRGYDASGRLVRVANGAGETTTFAYDAQEALSRVTLPDGTELQLSFYGEHGWPSFQTYAGSGLSAASSYDEVGNRVRGTIPDPLSGGVVVRRYDADRNVAAIDVADAPGSGAYTVRTIALEHRSDGQLRWVTRPGGGATTYSYDALGRLVAIAEQASPGSTPQAGALSVTTIERDLLGRVTALERANGMREETVYDAAGRVARRRALRNGVVESDVALEWAQGRLVRARDASGFDEALAYDAAGRLREVVHSQGESTRISYDARSRPTQTQLSLPGGAPFAVLSFGWDLADRETSVGYLGTNLVARTFSAGRLERTYYGNGIREDHFRNTETGRETGRELWRGSKLVESSSYALEPVPGGAWLQLSSRVKDGTSADGTTQEDFGYATLWGQNAMERRVAWSAVTSKGLPAEKIRYDALSNYTGGGSGMAQTLLYNAEGNRLLRAESPTGSPYLPTLASSYAYDAAGFVTAEAFASGLVPTGTNTFTWNARGQLTSIRANGALVASFGYDALGRRTERTLGSATKRWRFGGLVETSATGQPLAIDLGEVRIDLGGQHLFRHRDPRGNPKHVTNAVGRVVRDVAYGAYGQIGVRGSQADDVGFAQGTPVSTPQAQYVLIGSRLYSPRVARFLAPDPVWNPLNLYAYTLGNPVDFWDPSGLHAGSHMDLFRAQLGLAGSMIAFSGALLIFVAAPVGVPTVLAAIALAGVGVKVVDALLEVKVQSELHEKQTREERRSTGENRGGGGAASGGGAGGGRAEGGGFSEVCSDDGMDAICTRGPIGLGWAADNPRFSLY
jgi:RHS repeat-associated protein